MEVRHFRLSSGACGLGIGLLVCAAFLLGCGDSRLGPVSGVVTLDGEPGAGIALHFQPLADNARDAGSCASSHAITDTEGKYKLTTLNTPGAVVGHHVVTMFSTDLPLDDDSNTDLQVEFKLPQQARDGNLRFTDPESGTDQADFAFASKPDGESSNQ